MQTYPIGTTFDHGGLRYETLSETRDSPSLAGALEPVSGRYLRARDSFGVETECRAISARNIRKPTVES